MRTKRWSMGYVAVAVMVTAALVLAGCGTDDAVTSEEVSPTPTADDVTTTPDGPTTPPVFAPDAPLLSQGAAFEPGTYRANALGTQLSFTADQPLHTQDNSGGIFILSHLNSAGPDDRDLVFVRFSALSDPMQPQLSFDDTEGWPATDFVGWLDNLADGIVVSEPEETSIGGLDALVVDLELGDIECGSGHGYCLEFTTNNNWENKPLNKGSTYRIWFVDQADEDPLAVVLGIDGDSDESWLDTANDVLSTLAFGEIKRNPIRTVPAGPTEMTVLGGVAVDFPDEQLLIERGQGTGIVSFGGDYLAVTEFIQNPLTFDGRAIASSDELVTELESLDFEIVEIETVTIDGFDTRVIDVSVLDFNQIVLRRFEVDVDQQGQGWWSPEAARLWLIDHPERGLLMIAAEAFGDADVSLAVITPWTEQLLQTMKFVASS